MSFWTPNIAAKGRVIRGALGVVMLGCAVAFHFAEHPLLAWSCGLFGIFCVWEAARGWCLGRACGIKTRF